MMKWKRKMKEAFGLQGGTRLQVSLSLRAQVDKMLEEEKTPAPRRDERNMREAEPCSI